MTSTDNDYDQLLQASERFRNATEDMAWYLLSGNDHTPTREKLWQEMEEAREELWTLRSQLTAKAQRRTASN